jgi:anti-sigma B factor antagonist
MALEFGIEDRRVGDDTQVISVRGEIDLFTAPEFQQRIATPIDDGATRVVVDLTEVTFIDSSSLGVLIGAHQRLKPRGGGLVIVCDDRTIVNTFKITGLDSVFEIVSSRADVSSVP